MSKTSHDSLAGLQAALWEAGEQFGLRLSASDQVAVAQVLAQMRLDQATVHDVKDAFAQAHLARPSTAYVRELLSRVKRLVKLPSLHDVLLEFRQWAIRSLSEDFGGNTTGNENALRKHLAGFLPQRGYTEPHTGKGRMDIVLPPPDDAVIETKVWTTRQEYEDGLVELGRYIQTERPKQAFMVVFCDRDPLPPIVADHRQEIAEQPEIEGLVVPVIVVPFEVVAPSKAGREARRRGS